MSPPAGMRPLHYAPGTLEPVRLLLRACSRERRRWPGRSHCTWLHSMDTTKWCVSLPAYGALGLGAGAGTGPRPDVRPSPGPPTPVRNAPPASVQPMPGQQGQEDTLDLAQSLDGSAVRPAALGVLGSGRAWGLRGGPTQVPVATGGPAVIEQPLMRGPAGGEAKDP